MSGAGGRAAADGRSDRYADASSDAPRVSLIVHSLLPVGIGRAQVPLQVKGTAREVWTRMLPALPAQIQGQPRQGQAAADAKLSQNCRLAGIAALRPCDAPADLYGRSRGLDRTVAREGRAGLEVFANQDIAQIRVLRPDQFPTELPQLMPSVPPLQPGDARAPISDGLRPAVAQVSFIYATAGRTVASRRSVSGQAVERLFEGLRCRAPAVDSDCHSTRLGESPRFGRMPAVSGPYTPRRRGRRKFGNRKVSYSTVTDFARLRGWSTSVPLRTAV